MTSTLIHQKGYTDMSFYLSRKIHGTFDAVLEKMENLLHAHDYLIAANIDVQGALKEKLGADLPQIRIIGTNTPKVGYQLFSNDPKLGTLLPFSIVLHATRNDEVEVTMIDPEWLFQSVDNPAISSLASEVKQTFASILEELW